MKITNLTPEKAFAAMEIHLTQELERTAKRYGDIVALEVRVHVLALMLMILEDHKDDERAGSLALMATLETIAGWNKRIDGLASIIDRKSE